jgi:hypothetical protein
LIFSHSFLKKEKIGLMQTYSKKGSKKTPKDEHMGILSNEIKVFSERKSIPGKIEIYEIDINDQRKLLDSFINYPKLLDDNQKMRAAVMTFYNRAQKQGLTTVDMLNLIQYKTNKDKYLEYYFERMIPNYQQYKELGRGRKPDTKTGKQGKEIDFNRYRNEFVRYLLSYIDYLNEVKLEEIGKQVMRYKNDIINGMKDYILNVFNDIEFNNDDELHESLFNLLYDSLDNRIDSFNQIQNYDFFYSTLLYFYHNYDKGIYNGSNIGNYIDQIYNKYSEKIDDYGDYGYFKQSFIDALNKLIKYSQFIKKKDEIINTSRQLFNKLNIPNMEEDKHNDVNQFINIILIFYNNMNKFDAFYLTGFKTELAVYIFLLYRQYGIRAWEYLYQLGFTDLYDPQTNNYNFTEETAAKILNENQKTNLINIYKTYIDPNREITDKLLSLFKKYIYIYMREFSKLYQ